MQSKILYWLLLALFVAATSLGAASCAYFALRALEMRNRGLAVFLNPLVTLAFFILVGVKFPFALPYFLIYVLFAALCGFRFHQKSGGGSQSLGNAFLLMMAVALMTLGIEIFTSLLISLWLPSLSDALSNFGYLYSFLQGASIPLVPFLLWAYQNSRLRPGIDRHFHSNEEESSVPIA
ncbi:MAG: hypothetical protein EOO38_28430 [Cytophagaceae bacterium]|nr:MAG: hypothetical protein EOO38_28430 [Cytophagaceae bacterium]